VLALGQGCYGYRATELPSLVPGEEVRVELNEAEYRRVAPGAALVGANRLEGRFAGLTEDSLLLSVWIGEAYRGTPFESAYQDVPIPRSDVARVENRQLSRTRTALVSVGVAALIAVLIDSVGLVEIFGGGRGGDLPGPPEPDPLVGR
jgi:hypothetical protein